MASVLRNEVLKAFRNVHAARKTVFKGDKRTLEAARDKINSEFKKNKMVSDPGAVNDLITYANAVAKELRTTVVQAKDEGKKVYKLQISDETVKEDALPFNPNADIPKGKNWNKKCQCC